MVSQRLKKIKTKLKNQKTTPGEVSNKNEKFKILRNLTKNHELISTKKTNLKVSKNQVKAKKQQKQISKIRKNAKTPKTNPKIRQ